ncbi:hypothetical protein H0H93_012975 [Arthromyces matolae]|nr:hypothetical protein H0H93_012975 [Arthromyces matolae]
MSTTTTATTALKAKVLRQRTHSLNGKTHTTHAISFPSGSVTSSDSAKDILGASDGEGKETVKGYRRPTVVEDDSDYSEVEEDEAVDSGLRQRGVSENANSGSWTHEDPSSPTGNTVRAWYEFDLAVVVALVSPIGNWLTGGDHIKNFSLIMFLIFYLHQIIEVPWDLYHRARRRRPAQGGIAPSSAEDHYRNIANSELRALEFFFLGLTAVSPFVGAVFLRYATAIVMGDDAVSWFNTALFVMATGVRPWSHVIERLKQRTTDLHDVIHYPSPELAANDMRVQISDLMKRVEHLERSLSKAKAKLVDATEEVYDYVDEAVTVVDRAVRKHEKKYEKQEIKVQEIEQKLEGLKEGKGKQRATPALLSINTTPARPSILAQILPNWMLPVRRRRRSSSSPSSYSPSKQSLRSFPSSSSTQLSSIPEHPTEYSILSMPTNLLSSILSKIGYAATMPLRAVLRMIFGRY